jgi:hypothetical protein
MPNMEGFSRMVSAKPKNLLDYWQRNICLACGKNISPGTRVGTGSKADGGFCSLDCYTTYDFFELSQKANTLGFGKRLNS